MENKLRKQQNENPIVKEFLDDMNSVDDPNITLIHNDLVEAIILSAREAIALEDTENLAYELKRLEAYYWENGGRDVYVDSSDLEEEDSSEYYNKLFIEKYNEEPTLGSCYPDLLEPEVVYTGKEWKTIE